MATVKVRQLDPDFRRYPIDTHGKRRALISDYTAVGAQADGTQIDIGMLPPGRLRLLLNTSFVDSTALGAARVMKIGHRAYAAKDNSGILSEVEDDDAFATGLDLAAAGTDAFSARFAKFDIFSKAGVMVFATVTGGTIPDAAVLKFLLDYLYE